MVYVLLDAIIDFCKKNNIPISKEKGLWNLVKKARAIFKEIEEVNSQKFKPSKLSDESLQGKKSDRDFTEPFSVFSEEPTRDQ